MANLDQILTRLRTNLHAAHLDSGKSLSQLTAELGLDSKELTSDYLSGRQEVPLTVLIRFAGLTGKPLWWFFGEEPRTITLERANTALQNVGRMKLYLEALESEFQSVVGDAVPEFEPELSIAPNNVHQLHASEVVVDLQPYLTRAREILQREVSGEESGEVSEESIEMIAQGLYSAEMGCLPSRSFEAID